MKQGPENHSEDLELLEHLTIEPAPAVALHLSGCGSCVRRLENLQLALAAESHAVDQAIQALPAEFWFEQRRAVLRRIEAPDHAGAAMSPAGWLGQFWRPAVAAMCMLVLSATIITTDPVSVQQGWGVDADDELLREVQLMIQGEDSIGGLESLVPLLPEPAEKTSPSKQENGGKDVKKLG